MIEVPISLPKGFVHKIDQRAARHDLRRGAYIYQRVRSYLLQKHKDEFHIPPSQDRLRSGPRVACSFHGNKPDIDRLREVVDSYSLDVSEFVFHVLRKDILEGGNNGGITIRGDEKTTGPGAGRTANTKTKRYRTKPNHRLRRPGGDRRSPVAPNPQKARR